MNEIGYWNWKRILIWMYVKNEWMLKEVKLDAKRMNESMGWHTIWWRWIHSWKNGNSKKKSQFRIRIKMEMESTDGINEWMEKKRN